MTRYIARIAPFAFLALLAACGSDAPPETAKVVEAPKPAQPAQPLTAPRPAAPVGPLEAVQAAAPEPRQGDVQPFRRLGTPECDVFAEKARQCLNSGAVSHDVRKAAIRGIEEGIRASMRLTGPERVEACLNLQAQVQPGLISGGCQNL